MTDPEVKRLTELAEVADERDCALRENARLRARLDAITRSQQPPPLSPADTLAGAEEMLRRIAATACLDLDATEAAAIVAELKRLRNGIVAVSNLIDNSHGVVGLHLNGDEAPWDELRTGGRFEEWLRDFDAAEEKS